MTAFTPAPVHPSTPIQVPPKETPTKILIKLFSLKKIKLRAVKSKEKSPWRGSH